MRSTPTPSRIRPARSIAYKFGSLSHTDAAVRRQAIEHNIECIEIGQALGSKALSVWIGDGSNFPGQSNFTKAFERYIRLDEKVAKALPKDWRIFLEYKLYEPAFYSTVLADWGSSYLAAVAVGPQAQCLVDLGHHAHGTNIEMIVARLIQFGRLAGFHVNDSKYGDDDLDAGSINPYQLFLVFDELVDAAARKAKGFRPAYMLDQSHNVTDPIESLITSTMSVLSRLLPGAARRARPARRLPGRQRRADGRADDEAGVPHRRRPDPRQGAARRGRRDRPDRRLPRFEIPGEGRKGAAGREGCRRRHRLRRLIRSPSSPGSAAAAGPSSRA